MKIKEFIHDNQIVIVPDSIKNDIVFSISQIDTLFDCKVYGLSEFIKKYHFDYSYKTIDYLNKKYNIDPTIVEEMLQAMYYVDDITYNDTKLDKLVSYKHELIDNKLVQIDNTFRTIVSKKEVVLYGFNYIYKKDKKLLKNIDYKTIENDKANFKHDIYQFDLLDDELDYVFTSISKLLEDGVDINKIVLANVNSDYFLSLKRYEKAFNIKIENTTKQPLFSILAVKKFVDDIKAGKSKDTALDKVEDINIKNQLISVLNNLVDIDIKESINILIHALKRTYLYEEQLDNILRIVDINNYYKTDNYVFLLSFNQKSYPHIYKDDRYLNDKQCKLLDIDTTNELNMASFVIFNNIYNNFEHLSISYKNRSFTNSYTESSFVLKLGVKPKKIDKDNTISYSKYNDKLKLARCLDNENYDRTFTILNSNYEIDYNSFDNKFKPFDKELIKEYIKQTVKDKKSFNLSFTHLDAFYLCSFQYYLKFFIGLSEFVSTSATNLGKIFHSVLEDSFKNNFDFEKSFNKAVLREGVVEDKDLFYLDKLKPTLKEIIRINKENLIDSKLTKTLMEKKVSYVLDENLNIIFKGAIDKIYYGTYNDNKYFAVIDYKTSNKDSNLKFASYGINLQLPIYLHLIDSLGEFKGAKICGAYLQHLIPPVRKYNNEYTKELTDSIKYDGISNSDEAILSMFDKNYASSKMIKSMSTKKDGTFNARARVYSDKEFEELKNIAKDKIDKMLEDILNCNFEINPKVCGSTLDACKFCEFKDCCYKKYDDIVQLKDEKDGV